MTPEDKARELSELSFSAKAPANALMFAGVTYSTTGELIAAVRTDERTRIREEVEKEMADLRELLTHKPNGAYDRGERSGLWFGIAALERVKKLLEAKAK